MINLEPQILSLINQYYEDNKDDIKAIYLTGSRITGIINNPHDVDVVVLATDFDSWKKLKKVTLKDDLIHYIVKNFDAVHQIRSQLDVDMPVESKIVFHNREPKLAIKHLSWIDYERCYVKNGFLFGENVDDFLYWDMLKIDLTKIKELLKPTFDKQVSDNDKAWYHLYATKCILNNDSYDAFTEEQIRNINILHDVSIDTLEKRKELIAECKDFFIEKEN